jgi:penicillin-binding protein 1A
MLHYNDITAAQETAADNTPLPTKAPVAPNAPLNGNYPVLAVENFLLDQSSVLGATYDDRYEALFNGGLKIVTTINPTMQAQAQAAVLDDTPANKGGFIEGLVSIDPTSGAVRALVGGPPNTEFDTMTQGLRQPGSGFKLFTLLSALQQGYSVYDTVDSHSPCAIRFPGTSALVAKPINNDSGPGGGNISLVTATAQSVNCAYIRLAHEVGLANVLGMAYKLGISKADVPPSDQYDPSIVIGAGAVPPIEMAGAYAAVADQGVFHTPSVIDYVDDRTGNQIYKGLQPGVVAFSPQIAAEADVALRAVVTSGTGTGASLYNRPVAGKTGTTSNNVDAWFNGFTPQLETTVWMGNLSSDTVPIYIPGFGYVYGANFPAETWHTFMSAALAADPVVDLPSVENGLLPPTKFITSPSLVADDVLDHNASGSGCYYSPYSYQYGNYSGYCSTPYRTTPATAPVRSPPTTSGPPTTTSGPPTTTSGPPTTNPGGHGGGGGGNG